MTLPRTVVKRTAAKARMRVGVGDFMLSGELGLCSCLEFKETESLYIWWEVVRK